MEKEIAERELCVEVCLSHFFVRHLWPFSCSLLCFVCCRVNISGTSADLSIPSLLIERERIVRSRNTGFLRICADSWLGVELCKMRRNFSLVYTSWKETYKGSNLQACTLLTSDHRFFPLAFSFACWFFFFCFLRRIRLRFSVSPFPDRSFLWLHPSAFSSGLNVAHVPVLFVSAIRDIAAGEEILHIIRFAFFVLYFFLSLLHLFPRTTGIKLHQQLFVPGSSSRILASISLITWKFALRALDFFLFLAMFISNVFCHSMRSWRHSCRCQRRSVSRRWCQSHEAICPNGIATLIFTRCLLPLVWFELCFRMDLIVGHVFGGVSIEQLRAQRRLVKGWWRGSTSALLKWRSSSISRKQATMSAILKYRYGMLRIYSMMNLKLLLPLSPSPLPSPLLLLPPLLLLRPHGHLHLPLLFLLLHRVCLYMFPTLLWLFKGGIRSQIIPCAHWHSLPQTSMKIKNNLFIFVCVHALRRIVTTLSVFWECCVVLQLHAIVCSLSCLPNSLFLLLLFLICACMFFSFHPRSNRLVFAFLFFWM